MDRAAILRGFAPWMLAALVACGHGRGTGILGQERAVPPDPVALRLDLARALIDHGDFDSAVAPLRSVLAQHAENVEAHVLLAIAWRERSLPGPAERELLEAIRLDGNAAAAHGELGVLYDRTGRPAQALEQHALAVRFGGSVAAWHNNLGFSLYLAGRHAEAVTELEAALQLDPSLRRARNNLGFVLGAGRSAGRDARLREFGTPAEAQNNLGQVYERSGAPALPAPATDAPPRSTRGSTRRAAT